MTEAKYQSWWEGIPNEEFWHEFAQHPFITIRQIIVACDMGQAPMGVDHETYPTLRPAEALRAIKASRKGMVWPGVVEEGTRGPQKGDIPIHNNI